MPNKPVKHGTSIKFRVRADTDYAFYPNLICTQNKGGHNRKGARTQDGEMPKWTTV